MATSVFIPGGVRELEFGLEENIFEHEDVISILNDINSTLYPEKFKAFCRYLLLFLEWPLDARTSKEGEKYIDTQRLSSLISGFGGKVWLNNDPTFSHLVTDLRNSHPNRKEIATLLGNLVGSEKGFSEAGGAKHLAESIILKDGDTTSVMMIPWYNQFIVAMLGWMEGKSWSDAWNKAGETVRGKKFSILGAPLTELPFLPGPAVWGGVSSTLGIVGISAVFSFLHNLNPPENATERFAKARGFWGKAGAVVAISIETIGRTLKQFGRRDALNIYVTNGEGKTRIAFGVGWQFLIRTFVAFWINTWAFQFGVLVGDSSLATFVAAYVMHAVYNFISPYLFLPRLNIDQQDPSAIEMAEIKEMLKTAKLRFMISPDNQPTQTAEDLDKDLKAISIYIQALSRLSTLAKDLGFNRYPFSKSATEISKSIDREELYPNPTQIIDLLIRIAISGNGNIALNHLESALDFKSRFTVDQLRALKSGEIEIKKEMLNLEMNKKGGHRLTSRYIRSIGNSIKLSREQIHWLECYFVYENIGVQPSFQLLAIQGKKGNAEYYRKIWEDGGLKQIISDSWDGAIISRDSDAELPKDINDAFSMLLDDYPSEDQLRNVYPTFDGALSFVAEYLNAPKSLVVLLSKMDEKKFDEAVKKHYDNIPTQIHYFDKENNKTYFVFAHPAVYSQNGLPINPEKLVSIAKKAVDATIE